MHILKLKNRNFGVEPIPEESVTKLARHIGRKMGLPFVPMAVYYCDRTPGMKKLPKWVTLGPSPFFNGTDINGKEDRRKEARNKAGVKRALGIRGTKQLKALLAAELGTVSTHVPVKDINLIVPSIYRLVFGLYVIQKYFKVTVRDGPTKGAHFVMGLPIGVEWGMWRVGACGEYVTIREVDGPDGPTFVKLKKPVFRPGKYRPDPYATYTALDGIGKKPVTHLGLPDPPLRELESPNKKWAKIRHLPKLIPPTPDAYGEITLAERFAARRLQLAWNKTIDRDGLMAKYGQ